MTGPTIHARVWHRIRFGHWPTVRLTSTGGCLLCAMNWNTDRV